MNNLTNITISKLSNLNGGHTNTQPMMSSRIIAEVTNKRHDNVIRVCRELKGKAISPQIEETYYIDSVGRKYPECLLNKRDSLVLVARLSPEFTAAVVDRWQELEAKQYTNSIKEEHTYVYKIMQEINKQLGANKKHHFINLGKATKGSSWEESTEIRGKVALHGVQNFKEIAGYKQYRIDALELKGKVLQNYSQQSTTLTLPRLNGIRI